MSKWNKDCVNVDVFKKDDCLQFEKRTASRRSLPTVPEECPNEGA